MQLIVLADVCAPVSEWNSLYCISIFIACMHDTSALSVHAPMVRHLRPCPNTVIFGLKKNYFYLFISDGHDVSLCHWFEAGPYKPMGHIVLANQSFIYRIWLYFVFISNLEMLQW